MPRSFFTVEPPQVAGYPVVWSPAQRHRYTLWRLWSSSRRPRYVAWIGLNPSTATDKVNDNTIRRCIVFSKRWGYDAMVMLNLFAFRSRNPLALKPLSYTDAVGQDNNKWIKQLIKPAGRVVACWGTNGRLLQRGDEVCRLVRKAGVALHALDFNSDGTPLHPLPAKSDLQLKEWRW